MSAAAASAADWLRAAGIGTGTSAVLLCLLKLAIDGALAPLTRVPRPPAHHSKGLTQ